MSNIRVRIAPSPTGFLHVGTARTALFNYLFAKKQGGEFVLRIEDTDLERSLPEYEKDISDGLNWLGIAGDENPEKGGPYAPYRQSERLPTYEKHFDTLLRQGKIFYCFHSEKELEKEHAKLMEAKQSPAHICAYRNFSLAEAKTLAETKPDYIFRFKTPAGQKITFPDAIRGDVSFSSDLMGDFSVAKRPDVPLYNFAVVVDDQEMQISHVIRGEDHISNTPKQLLLINALGFSVPTYAHLPLLLGADRSKLSKRHGATSASEYRDQGYLPEALFNFMALLGWNPGNNREILTREEIIQEFSLERVQKAGAVFDLQKLDWMNGEYIRKKSAAELTKLCLPYLTDFLQFSIPNNQFSMEYIEKVIGLEQPRLKKLSEIGERTDYFFREPEYDKELLRWKNMSDQEILESLQDSEKLISTAGFTDQAAVEKSFLAAKGEGDKGRLLWPLRVALTGKKTSPGPFEILWIMGAAEAKKRLAKAKKLFG